MHRFEVIFEHLQTIDEELDPHALQKITGLLYKFYLTPKEQTYFRCLELYYQNKRQREISVLLNIDQPNLSAKFSKLRRKLKVIASFLTSTDLSEVFQLAKLGNISGAVLTARQFEILMYLLAGNKSYHIAQHLKVSPVAIHQTVTYLKKKLPSQGLPITFLTKLGTI